MKKKSLLMFMGIVLVLSLTACSVKKEVDIKEASVNEVSDIQEESDVEPEVVEGEDFEEVESLDETDEEEIADVEEESEDKKGTLTTVALEADVKGALASLDTDYQRVYWGVQYSLFEDYPGIVVSVTPCQIFDDNAIIVAITNLYDANYSFTADATALGTDGSDIGNNFIFRPNIGPGNTVIEYINCGENIPDGRIHWDNCSLEESLTTYVPWEADYEAKMSDAKDSIIVDYSIYASDGTECRGDLLTVLFLDETGFVLGIAEDVFDDIPKDEKQQSSVEFYADKMILSQVKGLAMFTNPSN